MAANPLTSHGAHLERQALRAYLRRMLREAHDVELPLLNEILAWVKTRQQRFDRKRGGLGRK